MEIRIQALTNREAYVVTCVHYDPEEGTFETIETVTAEEMGGYLLERLPYRPKADLFDNVKAFK